MLIDGGYITFGIGGIPKYHFYQNDHLGNVRVVSGANGAVEEVNHYYPYGALMGESQNTTTQPYKYNSKELDRTFGLDWYDYGARWLDGVGGRWSSMDPLCEKYYDVSPYVYCAGYPVNRVDDNGRKIVFVNGFLHFGSPEGGETYWNSMFVKGAQTTFKDNATPFFTNYDFKYFESASVLREFQGYQYAKQNYKKLTEGMTHGVDKFNFVSHSMGGAFAEGMIRYLSEKGWKTDNAVFLNAWEPAQINNKEEKTRIDATCTNDPVQWLSKPAFGEPDIPLSDEIIRIKSSESIFFIHRFLIDKNSEDLWKQINDFLKK